MAADELVELYNSLNLNPDETTEDLLYLRAYLTELLSVKPEIEDLAAELHHLTEALCESSVPHCNCTPADQPYSVETLEHHLKTVTKCLHEFERIALSSKRAIWISSKQSTYAQTFE
jgi:HEPN domain-containing protein